jgi:hypothetical protein
MSGNISRVGAKANEVLHNQENDWITEELIINRIIIHL